MEFESQNLNPAPRLRRLWLRDLLEGRFIFTLVVGGFGLIAGVAVTVTVLLVLYGLPTSSQSETSASWVPLHVTSGRQGHVVVNGERTNLWTPATVMVPSDQEYVMVGVNAGDSAVGSNERLVSVSAGSVFLELPSPYSTKVANDVPYRRIDQWADGRLPERPDRAHVQRSLRPALSAASACGQTPPNVVIATLVFAGATGRVVEARVDRTYRGTEVGNCVENMLLHARLPRFRQTTLTVRQPIPST